MVRKQREHQGDKKRATARAWHYTPLDTYTHIYTLAHTYTNTHIHANVQD